VTKRIVNINYLGGSHGAFLKYFVDKFSKLTPDITEMPFLSNGTSHSLKVQYSGMVERHTFEDMYGSPRNSYICPNKGEPQIVVTIDEKALMNFTRLAFTRKDDHELVSTTIDQQPLKNRVLLSDHFIKLYGQKFIDMYKIDIKDTKSVPYPVIRDLLKIIFLDTHQNRWLSSSRKILENIGEKTVCISLSEIWNTDLFMSKMKEVNDRLDLQLDLDEDAITIHKEFLEHRVNHSTWNRVFDIIESIKKKINTNCSQLDLVEQGYINAWLEKNHNFIQTPLTRNFFADTNEINEYIEYYPNHYKAMNPNMPTFNKIANPFYLWEKQK